MGIMKTFLIILLITEVLVSFESYDEMIEAIPYNNEHTIYVYFPTAVCLDEPDTLDFYGDGELIKTITTGDKAVDAIEYDSLGYRERVTVYSHVLDETYECATIEEKIESWNELIREAGNASLTFIEKFERCEKMCVGVEVDYQEKMIGSPDCHHEYEDWLAGASKVDFTFENLELVEEEKNRLLAFYNYKGCGYSMTYRHVEDNSKFYVVPRETETLYYVILNEERERVLVGKYEMDGEIFVNVEIELATCIDVKE